MSVVADPEPGGVSASWLFDPVADSRARLETVTTADGRPLCLHVLGDGVVGLDVCDTTNPTQVLDVTVADADGTTPTLTVGSGGSYAAVVDSKLTTTNDPAQATAFTVVDRGTYVRPTG